MINPAWPEIAKATPANLHHHMGHDQSVRRLFWGQRYEIYS